MRSMLGVGMTPPKVLGAPKPWSSVMMSSTLGAPFGGTTRGAHDAVDSEAFSLITPPNFGSGGGSCLPSIVAVALGEPGVPVICWGNATTGAEKIIAALIATRCPAAFQRFESPILLLMFFLPASGYSPEPDRFSYTAMMRTSWQR